MKTRFSALIVTLALGASVGICQQERLPPALASLVAAERAFAALSVDKGIRESFITFIAEDGIGFNPHPIKLRELYLKRQAPATKPPVTLNWQPVFGDISQAGDLGYTTGPYTFTDQSPEKRPPNYGYYFSVWKKQTGGSWKVTVDCGIDTPDHSKEKFEFKAAPEINRSRKIRKIDLESERKALINLEHEFLKGTKSVGVVNGFLSYLSKDARLHRNGLFPIIGQDAIQSFLAAKVSELTWEPIKSDVSQSGDLGYTYGSYEMKSAGTNETEKGYYVRVWKRDEKWNWKLVLDTLSPVPAEKT